MNDEVISKMIDIIKDSIQKTVRKENSEDTLTFCYDTKTSRYSIILTRVLEDGKKDIKEKTSLTLEEIIPFIKNPEFSSGVLEAYEARLEKEAKYEQTKLKLLQELASMDISDKDRKTMQAIIEQVSHLKRNRVTILDEDGFRKELRLADETGWSTQGSELHLQLIDITNDFGRLHHSYPKKTFAELVKYVSSLDISLETEKDKVDE